MSTQNMLPPTTYSSASMGTSGGVGGTSGGGANASGNALSLNLGGLNVSYDIGPNTEDFADQAYDYLSNSFDADSALLGSTIAGSQDFLSGLAQPALSESESQQTFNDLTLPTMFQTLQNQNQSLGSQAIQAESGVALASVQASSAEAANSGGGGGGFCWITTAVCEVMGWKDDCDELKTLRGFRDGWMSQTDERRALIAQYYDLCPLIEPQIKRDPHKRVYLQGLYRRYILNAVQAVKFDQPEEALRLYQAMVDEVRGRYPYE